MRKEGEREGNRNQLPPSLMIPIEDPAHNPGGCPCLGLELATLSPQAGVQSTELHNLWSPWVCFAILISNVYECRFNKGCWMSDLWNVSLGQEQNVIYHFYPWTINVISLCLPFPYLQKQVQYTVSHRGIKRINNLPRT